jgi:hypothetical protein
MLARTARKSNPPFEAVDKKRPFGLFGLGIVLNAKIKSGGRGDFAGYRAAAGPNLVVHVMVWASQVSLKCRHIS